ncbi:MAG: hypothetical protein AAFN41_13970 [Planctomycetota bacterium]
MVMLLSFVLTDAKQKPREQGLFGAASGIAEGPAKACRWLETVILLEAPPAVVA